MLLFKIEPIESKSIYNFKTLKLSYDDLCREIASNYLKEFGVEPLIVEYGHYCSRYFKNPSDPRLALCGKAIIDPTKDFTTTYSGHVKFGGKKRRRVHLRRTRKSKSKRKRFHKNKTLRYLYIQ